MVLTTLPAAFVAYEPSIYYSCLQIFSRAYLRDQTTSNRRNSRAKRTGIASDCAQYAAGIVGSDLEICKH